MKCRYADKCERTEMYTKYCTDSTMFKCLEGLQFLVAEQASDNAALQERCNELEKRFKELEEVHTYAEKVGSI